MERRHPMSKKLAAIALILGPMIAGGSAHAGDQDFWLVNHSGRTIAEAHLSLADSPSLGRDVLESSVLPDGQKTYIHFNPATASCYWDLIVVFRNSDIVGDSYDLCS